MTTQIIEGDCLDVLRTLPDESIQCCVTSPPYFGLRDYGVAGQLGLEPTPDAYLAKMVEVFAEVRRVLRKDGTLWLNIGDSYNGSGRKTRQVNSPKQKTSRGSITHRGTNVSSCKPKDLIGIPWMLAFALRADGWYLRSDIIWSKSNPMPESVTDRPTKAHEYLFLLTKSARYYYDSVAVQEEVAHPMMLHKSTVKSSAFIGRAPTNLGRCGTDPSGRNRRSVWTISTQPFKEAHFATMPPKLVEPCILAGSSRQACESCGAPWERQVARTAMVVDRSERTHEMGRTRSSGTMLEPPTSTTTGWEPSCDCENTGSAKSVVLDPFSGAGTVGLVAGRLGRDYIGIELNPEYAEMSRRRIHNDAPLFTP